jgi:hypothetical protein
MASISPICKKCKNFISALKSPTYRDFMIKKSLKSKTSKSHTWAPLSTPCTNVSLFSAFYPAALFLSAFFFLLTILFYATILDLGSNLFHRYKTVYNAATHNSGS